MIPCSAEEYYHKVDNMVLSSCQNVRKLLRARWKTETGKDWIDGEEQGKEFIQRYGQIHKQAQKIQKSMIASGCLEEWDMSTLSSVIQNFGDATAYKRENEAVRALTRMRNDLAHHPTKKLSLDDYTKKVDTLRESLLVLGVSKNDITKVIEKAGITSSVQALESVKKLYEAAMIHEKAGGDIEKAIECYTEAISTPSLLPVNQGVAYENRANCYLNQLRHLKSAAGGASSTISSDDEERRGNLLQQALLDSNQALELNDNSWKAHYLVAQCLRFSNKLTDAINHYHKALAISPVQKQVKQDLDVCKVLATSQEREDHLNPSLMPMNLRERVDHLRNETGFNLTEDQFLKTSNMAGELIKGQDHVSRGHQYFGGWNVRQDFAEAARHYAKAAHVGNAEGIYNLGLCYKTGRGVEQDIAKAFMYFSQAAEMSSDIMGGRLLTGAKDVGVAAAQCSLGLMYEGGIYVEQDYTKAAKWFQKSAENGMGNAANNLAILYSNGLGVPKDEKMAENYWNRGVILKDVNAAASLMQYYIRHLEPEKALNMFKIGKELGHPGLIHLTDEELNGLLEPARLGRKEVESRVVEFEKQHKLETKGLTFMERLDRHISSQSVAGNQAVKMVKTLNSGEAWGGRLAKNKIFDPDVLKCLTEKAQNGSITAKRLLETVDYGVEIMERLDTNDCTTEEEQMEIVRLFYKCATLELHAAPIPTIYSDKLKRIFGGLFDSKCETTGEDDMQIRFCFVSFNLAGSMESSQDTFDVELLKQGIRRYPNNPNYYQHLAELYANKKDYSSSLNCSEEGLAKFPEHIPLLYVKAFCLHSKQDQAEAIEAYKEFLRKAPPDDRKVPEAYYTLAYQYIESDDHNGMKKLERYYKRGLNAEKNQLPIYLPYCSSARKNMIECLLDARNPSSPKGNSSTNQSENEPKGILARKPYLANNPVRTSIIHRHRENLSKHENAKKNKRTSMMTSTVAPKLTQKCAKKMSTMKPITLEEMNPISDHIYEDRVLDLTIIEDAMLGYPSVHLIAEDDNGDVTRLYLYNVEQNRQTQEKFGFGCRIAIINPYMRIGAQDISHGIRNDEPKCMVHLEKVVDMCRFCGEEKAPHKCSKCKRTYCSRECQKLDWKIFNHNLICPLKL